MARITITLSQEAMDNMDMIRNFLSQEMGGARITTGFAIGYALKKCAELEKNKNNKGEE